MAMSLNRFDGDVWLILNKYLSVEDAVKLSMTGPWWHRRQLSKTIRYLSYFRQPIPAHFIAASNTAILVHLDLSKDCSLDEIKYTQYLACVSASPLQTLILPTDRCNESAIHVDIAELPTTLTHLNLGIAFPKTLDGDRWRWHETLPHLQSLSWLRGRGIVDEHFLHLRRLERLDTLSVHGWELNSAFVLSLPGSLTTLEMDHSLKTIKDFCEQLPRGLLRLACPLQHLAQNVKALPSNLTTLYYSVNQSAVTLEKDWLKSLPQTITSFAQKDSLRHGNRGIRPEFERQWERRMPASLTRLGPITPILGKYPLGALINLPDTLTDLYWHSDYNISRHDGCLDHASYRTRFARLKSLRTHWNEMNDLLSDLHTLAPNLTRLQMDMAFASNQKIARWPANLTSVGVLKYNHGHDNLPPTVTKLSLQNPVDDNPYLPESDSIIAIPASVTCLHLHTCANLVLDLTRFKHITRLVIHDLRACLDGDIHLLPPNLTSLKIYVANNSTSLPARSVWFQHSRRLETMQVVGTLVPCSLSTKFR